MIKDRGTSFLKGNFCFKRKQITRSASAYYLKGKIFIQGYSKTTQGISMLDGPVFMGENHNLKGLGQAVLNDCKTGIYHPMPHEYTQKYRKDDPILIATGMKTWNALEKGSKNVDIKAPLEDQITFTPMRFLGTSGDQKGYEWIHEKRIVSDLDLENLGRALMEAFSLSENPYLKE